MTSIVATDDLLITSSQTHRLHFVFSYERFDNALICMISRFTLILNFPIFRKDGALLELLNIVTVFENSLPTL